MKRELGIALIIIALVVGVLVGYGFWGTKASQAAELRAKVEQLTQENTTLKSQLPAAGAPPMQAPEATPTAPPGAAPTAPEGNK